MGAVVPDHPAHIGSGLPPGAGGKPLRVLGGGGVVQHGNAPKGMPVDGAGDMEIQRVHMGAGKAQVGRLAEVSVALRQIDVLHREQIALFSAGQE